MSGSDASEETIRILLVDDHPIVVDGLAAIFSREPGLEIVGRAGGGGEALEQAARHQPDVVLLDLGIPPPAGADLIQRLRMQVPNARVLILTTYDDDEHLYEAVSAGVAGYLVKGAPVPDVVEAVRAVHRGESLLDPELTSTLFARIAGTSSRGAGVSSSPLTAREQQVLELLVGGVTNREIADALFVSPRTVKAHLASIFEKLGVHDRTAAAMEAVRRGLVQVSGAHDN